MTGREPCDECGVMTEISPFGRTLCSDCRSYAFEEGEKYEVELGEFEIEEIEDGDVTVRFSEYATTYDAEMLDEKIRNGEVVVA